MKWTEELRRLLHRMRKQPPEEEPGGISCWEAAERLFEWLDGELDEDTEERVGTHLEACARCYPRLLFEQSFREAVARAVGHEGAPEQLRERILEQLETEGFGS
jgi:anti-sigma factor (TIGR02949 family)